MYVEDHATRKYEVSWALGGPLEQSRRGKKRKTNVAGTGQWKTWTAQAMLRSAFLIKIQYGNMSCQHCDAGVIVSFVICICIYFVPLRFLQRS